MTKQSLNFAVILPAAGRSRRFLSSMNECVNTADAVENVTDGMGNTADETINVTVDEMVNATQTTICEGEKKKVYTSLLGRPVWSFAAELFAKRQDVARILLVIAREDLDAWQRQVARLIAEGHVSLRRLEWVYGGAERGDSIRNALRKLLETETNDRETMGKSIESVGWVAVHDAARPCITNEDVDRIFTAVQKYRAVIPAVPVAATLKRERVVSESNNQDVWIGETVSRQGLWEAQTPQVFEKSLFIDAYDLAEREMNVMAKCESNSIAKRVATPTDDAQLVERLGVSVAMVRCSSMNLKITTLEDLRLAEAILRSRIPQID